MEATPDCCYADVLEAEIWGRQAFCEGRAFSARTGLALGFAGQTVSVITTELYPCIAKAATDRYILGCAVLPENFIYGHGILVFFNVHLS